jgi:hypothetical protein
LPAFHLPDYPAAVELADKWSPWAMVVDDTGRAGDRAVYF